MSSNKQRLELTWVDKDVRPKLEPRILLEDRQASYHARERVSDLDLFDNRVICGDNLLALKALEQEFAGRVKCVYIDPPFNTKGAFPDYDDNVEHSLWLTLMARRLELLRSLLHDSGAIVVNLDDSEMAYCKVLLDEVFGRRNYVATIVVEVATPSSFKTVNVGPTQITQYLLLYCKNKDKFEYHQQYIAADQVDLQHFSRYIENPEDPPESWRFASITSKILADLGFVGATSHAQWAEAKRALGEDQAKQAVSERAQEFALQNADRVFETKTLQKPSPWLRPFIAASRSAPGVVALGRENREPLFLYQGRQIYFLGKGVREINGQRVVIRPLSNLWDDIPTNNLQHEGGVDFPSGKKPEALVARVIEMISQDRADIVLDCFGGSGTTAAVAHKLGRQWILVEQGEHCYTKVVPRMQAVIDGRDPSGITEYAKWAGGGGFRLYNLAPSLMEKDRWDNWVVSREYNAAMLAEAVCKLEAFRYEPSDDNYWQHGRSTEHDFIYITTQTLTKAQLDQLSLDVGSERTLLVCCGAWKGKATNWNNLTLRKIPQAVLSKCEWGRDDYSLEVGQLPDAPRMVPTQRDIFDGTSE